MSAAGIYKTRFRWLTKTAEADTTYGGQLKPEYTSTGLLWGYTEELRAFEAVAFSLKGSETACKIHIRNSPAIRTVDRLQDAETEDVYFIDGITEGDNELLIYCHKVRT